jgi:hypothetical protein
MASPPPPRSSAFFTWRRSRLGLVRPVLSEVGIAWRDVLVASEDADPRPYPNGDTVTVHAYGLKTWYATPSPVGGTLGGSAICADGKRRRLLRLAAKSDGYGIPAAVRVGRRCVSGYVTVESARGRATSSPDDPAVVKFVAYRSRHGAALPPGAWRL